MLINSAVSSGVSVASVRSELASSVGEMIPTGGKTKLFGEERVPQPLCPPWGTWKGAHLPGTLKNE